MRGARHIPGPRGLPLFKPPWGRLVAIDLNRGEILWTAANGDGPRDHPAIAHLDLPPLGQGGRAAPLVTRSLVFLGEGANVGAAFLAARQRREDVPRLRQGAGAIVWETELPGGTTVRADQLHGRRPAQYIVATIGWRRHEQASTWPSRCRRRRDDER